MHVAIYIVRCVFADISVNWRSTISLLATPTRSGKITICINTNLLICVSANYKITKMYDMLNKNSLGLLKKGVAKQNRIKSIEALIRACG